MLKYEVCKSDKGDDSGISNPKAELLEWCNSILSPQGLAVSNFTSSWTNGMAFCGLLNSVESDLIPMAGRKPANGEENLELAFKTALERTSCPRLLDVLDFQADLTDELSVITYVATLKHFMAKA